MTYRGRVKNGVIVLESPGELPEGTEVRVLQAETCTAPSLADRYADFIGIFEGLPADLAENHDRYIHGKPERQE
jgi:hypothetical protein